MTNQSPSKVVLIGMDGLIPEMIEKFIAEGILPNMGHLIQLGTFSSMLPVPPVDTPTNWTSLATGAWPATHGINSFCIHHYGDPFDLEHYTRFRWNIFHRFPNRPHAFLNRFSRAEYIWQAAERAGKRCILVNYPGGWPPNIESGIVVDGSGPLSSTLSRLAHPVVATTTEAASNNGNQTVLISVAPAEEWVNLPVMARPALAAELPLLGSSEGIEEVPCYHLLLLASSTNGYDKVAVCKERNASQPLTILSQGQWSPWLHETFNSPFGPLEAQFRLKLITLSAEGHRLKIYRSTIWYLDEWAYPNTIAEELVEDAFRQEELAAREAIEGAKTFSRVNPFCQVTESIEDQVASIAATCTYLSKNYDWDLFAVQIHAPDGINHDHLNGLCCEWAYYDPGEEQACWNIFRHEYHILDKMVGEIVAATNHNNPVVIVLSDHGAIPTTRIAWVGKALIDAGLLVLNRDNVTGKLSTDLRRSRVILGDFPLAQNIWVNLKGRELYGFVESGREYEEVREQTIQTLYSIRDIDTGRCPVVLALRTEDAAFLGQGGATIGDIVYFYAAGYTSPFWLHTCGPFDPDMIPGEHFEPVGHEVQGIHHAYLPSQQYAGFSVRATLILAGPGVKAGHRLPRPPWTVDIAPTIAHILGIAPPATCEGNIIGGAFEV